MSYRSALLFIGNSFLRCLPFLPISLLHSLLLPLVWRKERWRWEKEEVGKVARLPLLLRLLVASVRLVTWCCCDSERCSAFDTDKSQYLQSHLVLLRQPVHFVVAVVVGVVFFFHGCSCRHSRRYSYICKIHSYALLLFVCLFEYFLLFTFLLLLSQFHFRCCGYWGWACVCVLTNFRFRWSCIDRVLLNCVHNMLKGIAARLWTRAVHCTLHRINASEHHTHKMRFNALQKHKHTCTHMVYNVHFHMDGYIGVRACRIITRLFINKWN